MLDAVNTILGSPAVKQGLRMAAPELTMAVDLVRLIGASIKRPRNRQARELVSAIDQRVAKHLQTLADPETSKSLIRETEVRIHELLGVLQAWKQ